MWKFTKALAIMWLISAIINLVVYCVSWDYDKLLISMLEFFMASYNYQDYKREKDTE